MRNFAYNCRNEFLIENFSVTITNDNNNQQQHHFSREMYSFVVKSDFYARAHSILNALLFNSVFFSMCDAQNVCRNVVNFPFVRKLTDDS